MNLDDQIAKFLADAETRPARSKLEPCAELVRELRQRRWTYRKIADALREGFAVTASPSTIHDFVKVRARRAKAEIQPTRSDCPQNKAGTTTAASRRFFTDGEIAPAHFGPAKSTSAP